MLVLCPWLIQGFNPGIRGQLQLADGSTQNSGPTSLVQSSVPMCWDLLVQSVAPLWELLGVCTSGLLSPVHSIAPSLWLLLVSTVLFPELLLVFVDMHMR